MTLVTMSLIEIKVCLLLIQNSHLTNLLGTFMVSPISLEEFSSKVEGKILMFFLVMRVTATKLYVGTKQSSILNNYLHGVVGYNHKSLYALNVLDWSITF